MAMRNHLPIALIATGVVTLCVLLLCVLLPSGSQDTAVRMKRSLPSQKFVFHNGVHRIHWTRNHGLKSKGSPVNDVFISVKTTEKFHQKRLEPILNTWFQLAKSQIWFFSDASDSELDQRTGGHLVNTKCPSTHNRSALCCKMAAELMAFLASNERWFCHFDDDNYVNVPALVRMLERFDPKEEWYLGKPSVQEPFEVVQRKTPHPKPISFWFATGGAGFCLSRPLVSRLRPLVTEGAFESTGDQIRLPDDVTLGFVIEHLANVPLTIVKEFHSHLEPLKLILEKDLHNQVSFSYSNYGGTENILNVDGLDASEDPTRFLSLHCKLFPESQDFCH